MSQSLFSSQTPSLPDVFEGSPVTVGNTLTFDTPGTVSGARLYVPATVGSGTYTATFWQVTVDDSGGVGAGTLLASGQFLTLNPGPWVSVNFSPVSVDTSHAYVIAVRSTEGRYAATGGLFTSAIVNGHITGIRDGSAAAGFAKLNNGRFTGGVASYPENTFGSNGYFIDVLYDPSGTVQTIAAALTGTANLTATLSAQTTVAGALSGAAPLSSALSSQTTVAAALSGSASLTAALSVPAAGPVDLIATPVAQELLACFTEKLQTLPNPPAKIQLRVGQETSPLAGPDFDECCAGLAWVRVSNVYPSWDSFPSADNTWNPCGPLAYAVVLEMGIAFCMPWSDSDDSFESLDPPSTNDWATAFATQMQHQALMRQTAACCFRPTQRRAVGEWTSAAVEGGCTGGKLTVTVSVMNPCSDC